MTYRIEPEASGSWLVTMSSRDNARPMPGSQDWVEACIERQPLQRLRVNVHYLFCRVNVSVPQLTPIR